MAEWSETGWSGRKTYVLRAGGYEAVLVPALGANVIRFFADWEGKRIEILRTPAADTVLLQDPYAYGIPILFPANRVSGGQYSWDGVNYVFPQNYPNHVHIHGVLHNREWPVDEIRADNRSVSVRLVLDTNKDVLLRKSFPVSMWIALEIRLDEYGLHHIFTVGNQSDRDIPVGLAYHTALRTDFGYGPEGMKLMVPLKGRCTESGEDRMPYGKTDELDEYEKRITQGADPLEKAIDYLYTSQGAGLKAVMRDEKLGCEVVYQSDRDDRYWILWNATATEGFISVEPQTWLTNAMNTPDPVRNGAVIIRPGCSWTNECVLSVRRINDGSETEKEEVT